MRPRRLLPALMSAVVLAGCGSGFDDEPEQTDELTVMIGSSGEAETAAVEAAVQRWSEESGISVEVIPAQDLNQQLGQGFAGGNPPDIFYLGPDRFRQYAEGGSLYPYGDQITDYEDFYPALRDSYTYDGELYCVPKDFGTHALVINVDMWEAAGLTEDDIPTTWEELTEVATRLTNEDHIGLAFTGDYNPVGTFMLAGGGWFLNEDNTAVTADTPENLATLEYLNTNIQAGIFAFATSIDTGWGGEAFGTGAAAMTVEGPWIIGALNNDFPDINWRVVEMPAGPGGQGTTVFSNCWGIAANSGNHEAAVDLVDHLVSPEEQQAFAEAFGALPSRSSLESWVASEFPEQAAFSAGVRYARGPVPVVGFDSVLADFNTGLEAMVAGGATPQEVLAQLQRNGEEVLTQ